MKKIGGKIEDKLTDTSVTLNVGKMIYRKVINMFEEDKGSVLEDDSENIWVRHGWSAVSKTALRPSIVIEPRLPCICHLLLLFLSFFFYPLKLCFRLATDCVLHSLLI